MVLSNGRSAVCEQFTSVWEVRRRIVSTVTVGTYRLQSEYLLLPAEPEKLTGFRDTASRPETDIRWTLDAALRSPALWAVMPFVLFVPVLLMTRIGKRHDEVMARLGQVAEADARA